MPFFLVPVIDHFLKHSLVIRSDGEAEFSNKHPAAPEPLQKEMSTTTRALDWRGRGADVDALLAHMDQLQGGEVRVSTGSFEKESAA
jgi:hypothetical protein